MSTEASTHLGEWSPDPGVGPMDPGVGPKDPGVGPMDRGETSVDVKCVRTPGGLELGGPRGVKGRPLAEVRWTSN